MIDKLDEQTIDVLSSWPLEISPEEYTSQGSSFSELIGMLLRMRGVLPVTKTDPVTGYLMPATAMEEVVMRWFRDVKLTGKYSCEGIIVNRANHFTIYRIISRGTCGGEF
jgi:hypothetical protein